MNNPIMEELPNGMIGFVDNPEREPLTEEQFERLQEIQGGIWILIVEPENYLNRIKKP